MKMKETCTQISKANVSSWHLHLVSVKLRLIILNLVVISNTQMMD